LVVNVSRVSVLATPLFWLPWFPYFAIGWIAQQLSSRRVDPAPALSFLLLAVTAALAGQHQAMQAGRWSGDQAALAAMVAVLTAALLGLVGSWPLWHRMAATAPGVLLTQLGLISYSVYLLHVPIGCFLIQRLRTPFVLQHRALHLLFDLLTLLVVLLVSSLFHHWIERPCHGWSRRFGRSADLHRPVGAPLSAG
jgi:peptidoglycan/LPS O-acetylase OafA/YrhL